VGSSTSEIPTWSSVYTRRPERRSSNPLLSTLHPLSIFPFPGQVTNRFPISSSSPIIHSSNDIHHYPSPQNDPSLAVSDCQFSPALLPGVGQEGSRSQCDMDGDSRPFGIYCFCILFKPNGRLFYSRTSPLSPAIGDVPPHPISMSVTLGSTFRAGFVLFYYPHPLPLPYSPHLVRLWSVFSQVGALFTHRPSWT